MREVFLIILSLAMCAVLYFIIKKGIFTVLDQLFNPANEVPARIFFAVILLFFSIFFCAFCFGLGVVTTMI